MFSVFLEVPSKTRYISIYGKNFITSTFTGTGRLTLKYLKVNCSEGYKDQ